MIDKLKLVSSCFRSGNSYFLVYKEKINLFIILLLLTTFISLPYMIKSGIQVNNFIQREVNDVINQLPEISIEQGILNTQNSKRFELISNETIICIIDPNKSIYNDLNNEKERLRFYADGVIIEKENSQYEIVPFQENLNIFIDESIVRNFLVYVPIVFIIFMIFYIIFKYCALLFYGVFHFITAMIIKKIYKIQIDMLTTYNLILLASFPAIIFEVIVNFFDPEIRIWFIYFIITVVYLVFGISEIKKRSVEEQKCLTTSST